MRKARTRKSTPYGEKFKDPRWQKLRLEVLQRDEFKCRHCQDDQNTLNIHHANYRRGAEPWDYPMDNFVTLCEPCHRKVEHQIYLIRKTLSCSGGLGTELNQFHSALAHAWFGPEVAAGCGWFVGALNCLDSIMDETSEGDIQKAERWLARMHAAMAEAQAYLARAGLEMVERAKARKEVTAK